MFTMTPRIERLTQMVHADSHNQSAHFLLGQEYLAEGRYMEAAAKFRRVVELNPEYGEAWFMLGQAYEKVGVLKESVSAYTTAVTVFTRLDRPEQARQSQAALDSVLQYLAKEK